MTKSLRLSEKWFNRGLWLVAILFSQFLIGLGQVVMQDLPKVEQQYTAHDFIDPELERSLEQQQTQAEKNYLAARQAVDKAEQQLNGLEAEYASAHGTFSNWLATRQVTEQHGQDKALIERTKQLDKIKARQDKAQTQLDELLRIQEQKYNEQQTLEQNYSAALAEADLKVFEVQRQQELKVFFYRLLLALPLLALALWLFNKKRKTKDWPFVWGFLIFAAYTFFVELVPYLPSYGGYIRYIVGLIVTIFAGRKAIFALNNYLEKQKQAEQLPEQQRREKLSYDMALSHLAKNVCPGCERGVDLKNPDNDFCPHCGIGLFDYCGGCQSRKNAFSKFCHRCGLVSCATK